jgi:hypothetical protein
VFVRGGDGERGREGRKDVDQSSNSAGIISDCIQVPNMRLAAMIAEMACPIPPHHFPPPLLLDECPHTRTVHLGAIEAHPALLPKTRRIHLPVGMIALLAAAHCLADGIAPEKGVAEACK